jgi:hypothetical protein
MRLEVGIDMPQNGSAEKTTRMSVCCRKLCLCRWWRSTSCSDWWGTSNSHVRSRIGTTIQMKSRTLFIVSSCFAFNSCAVHMLLLSRHENMILCSVFFFLICFDVVFTCFSSNTHTSYMRHEQEGHSTMRANVMRWDRRLGGTHTAETSKVMNENRRVEMLTASSFRVAPCVIVHRETASQAINLIIKHATILFCSVFLIRLLIWPIKDQTPALPSTILMLQMCTSVQICQQTWLRLTPFQTVYFSHDIWHSFFFNVRR